MSDPGSKPSFQTHARLAVVAVALALVAAIDSAPRVASGARIEVELGAFVALVATGMILFVSLDAVRAGLRRGGSHARHAIVSCAEAMVVFGFGFVAEPFASLEGERAWLVVLALSAMAVVHALVARRWPRLALAVVACALVAAAVAHGLANPGLYGWFHSACCVIALTSVARLADLLGPGVPARPRLLVAVAVVAFVLAHLAVASPDVRARCTSQSPTVAALAKPTVYLSDVDRDGAGSLFGNVDCAPLDASRGPFVREHRGDGIDQDCDGIDAPAPPRHGATADAIPGPPPDVLVLSIDAFRADASGALVRTREALSQPYEFSLAVAPSVRTMNSFAALLRGTTLDELPFGRDSLRSTLVVDDRPTIGDALRRRGYRSAFVATHSYLAPRTGIVRGFDFLRAESMPYDDPSHRELEAMLDADTAIDLVLGAARETPTPLFVWAHLMETHAPYRASRERIFGTTRADYDRALALQDARIASAIERFRAIRGRPAIVVILGDHGESFGEHGFVFHSSSVHAEQARVPFLLSIPGRTGRVVDAPASTAALAPTLLELIGAPPEPSFSIAGLGACLEDDGGCPRVAITELFSLGRPGDVAIRAYTTARERWIVDRAHDVAQRFDLRRDPGELRPRTRDAGGVARSLMRSR